MKLWQRVKIIPRKDIYIKHGHEVDVKVRDTYNHDAFHLCGCDPRLTGEIGYIRRIFCYPDDPTVVRSIKEGPKVFPIEVQLLGLKSVLVSNVEVVPI